MKPERFFLFALPSLWLIAALVSWKYPGDEFLLFQLVNGLPAAWLPLLFGPIRGADIAPLLLSVGLITVATAGWLMDRLRVGKVLWMSLYVIGVPLLVWWGIAEFPSYERAIAKNGSLAAYVAAAINLSLYLASTLALSVTLFRRVAAFSVHRLNPG